MTKDKYDLAIEYLIKHPDQIGRAWESPFIHIAGCLFQFASPSGITTKTPQDEECGCLTMIRGNKSRINHKICAWTEKLTKEIENDLSLPDNVDDITTHHLPIFARWQRRLDVEIRGIKPIKNQEKELAETGAV